MAEFIANTLAATDQFHVDVEENWVGLALAVLQSARELQEHERFAEYEKRLKAVPSLCGNDAARLCYERCLEALHRLDYERVRT
jgi:DNA relaxase NicK